MATVEPGTPRTGRARELGLLVGAVVLGMGAYAQVELAMHGSLPADFYVRTAGLVVLAAVLHVLVRKVAPFADQVILPIAVALNGLGLAMIHRLDLADQAAGRSSELASKQLGITAVGVLAAAAVLLVLRDHRRLRKRAYVAMVAALALIVLPFVPGLGVSNYGARIWISLAGFSLQPAELAKIALAIFFAGYLVTNRDTLALAGPRVLGVQLPRPRDLGPIIVVWAVSLAILVLQRDLGTSLLLFGLFVAMLYVATERISWIAIGMVLFAGGAALAAQTFGHVAARFDVWLNPMDPAIYDRAPGGSYQLVQGLFGLASGGLMGAGWGQGNPELVTFAESDFIIAALGEELGLTGLLAIIMLYVVLVQRGFRTAIGVRDGFGKLLASGLSFVIAWQVFVVVGGITRVIPLTGLTTPFLAYGGSSLLANWIIVALLLRISDAARRPAPLPVRGGAAPVIHDADDEPDDADGKLEPTGSGPTTPDSHPTEVIS
ncbi:FtsW/RodA/SpoVE family cell cycle protein [Sanguibacter sp. A247]|uniref:FtsW/RodA/SpoVE family cell cycle protein n=1 Tax=unclassified Sanguibacter TaxID=2645534 RepID=UPI003FD86396